MTRGTALPVRHLLLAWLAVLVWGVNFTVIDAGLADFPPLLFAALRFAAVAVCCLFVPRPQIAWRWLLLVGLFTGTGQYALLYLGMAAGMPAGLSSLVMQAQVVFTLVFAALALRERPSPRQAFGIAVSAVGLGIVGLARGGSVSVLSLLLVLGGAASWAIGNVCTRIAKPDNGFRLVIWSSVVPPLPLLALSLLHEGAHRDITAFGHAGLGAWLSLAYSVGLSTILAMGSWSLLLSRHPADRVVPYALAIPVIGFLTGRIARDESVTAPMLLGAAVVILGLALVVSRFRWRFRPGRAESAERTDKAGSATNEAARRAEWAEAGSATATATATAEGAEAGASGPVSAARTAAGPVVAAAGTAAGPVVAAAGSAAGPRLGQAGSDPGAPEGALRGGELAGEGAGV
ncbi:EamA family transporter [Actinocrinis sp.]|uniref:EamA family transporter n=1 Tax=Actinocrinis sp. TaxID=1920516 RepID=UPI002D642006|nr:EamA family transporter [Actinocrinis sp.]HZP54051.1 EamA family transporter [Actinocrinis sp.]